MVPLALPQDLLHTFKSKFWDAFHRPNLKSEKYTAIWLALEPINDWLAGPLFSIYENGDCNYVFADKERFMAVDSPSELLEWGNGVIMDYKEAISAANAKGELEQHDRDLLHYQIDIKSELMQLGYQIQSHGNNNF